MEENTSLIRIDAGWFCAGLLVSEQGVCVEAAPCLRRHRVIGMDREAISAMCRTNGWLEHHYA